MPKSGGAAELLLCCIIATLFATPEWVAEIEHVWKKKWLGYSLIAASFVVFAWFTWCLPPSGYGVVAMAVAAGIMAIRPEMGGWERSLWFVILVCFAIIEIRAINHDREKATREFTEIASGLKTSVNQGKTAIQGLQTTINEGREHFDTTMARSNVIMSGIADSIKTQTGGDSFAFITFTAEPAQAFEMHWNNFLAPSGEPYFLVSVTSHGKYPLRGTQAIMMDDERRLAAMQEYNKHPNGDWIKAINSADTEYQLPYLRPQSTEAPQGEVDVIGIYPMPQGDTKKLTINFSAPNGYWNEVLHLGRVNRMWHQCLSVLGPTVKQAKHQFIYCDSDWPEGKKLAEKDWVFTPPKMQ
jgi:hypothetical protein